MLCTCISMYYYTCIIIAAVNAILLQFYRALCSTNHNVVMLMVMLYLVGIYEMYTRSLETAQAMSNVSQPTLHTRSPSLITIVTPHNTYNVIVESGGMRTRAQHSGVRRSEIGADILVIGKMSAPISLLHKLYSRP